MFYCREKPIKDCITYIAQNAQKRAPKNDSEIPPSSVPDETVIKRKRSRSSLSEATPLVKKQKVTGSSCSSSSDHEENDVFANSSTAPNHALLQNVSSSSDTENDSENKSEFNLPSATPGPSAQEESHTSASPFNTQPDRSTVLSDNSQPSGKQTFPRFYYCKNMMRVNFMDDSTKILATISTCSNCACNHAL